MNATTADQIKSAFASYLVGIGMSTSLIITALAIFRGLAWMQLATRPRRARALLALLLSAEPLMRPASRRTETLRYRLERAWEVSLSGTVKERNGLAAALPHYVGAVQFSDDERWIAVSIGQHSAAGQTWSHLILVSAGDPASASRQFDYQGSPSTRIEWSADGGMVAISPARYRGGIEIFHLSDGGNCQAPGFQFDFARFINGRFGVIGLSEPNPADGRSRTSWLTLYDGRCHQVARTAFDGVARSLDASEPAGLIAVGGFDNRRFLMIDDQTLAARHRGSGRDRQCGLSTVAVQFAARICRLTASHRRASPSLVADGCRRRS